MYVCMCVCVCACVCVCVCARACVWALLPPLNNMQEEKQELGGRKTTPALTSSMVRGTDVMLAMPSPVTMTLSSRRTPPHPRNCAVEHKTCGVRNDEQHEKK